MVVCDIRHHFSFTDLDLKAIKVHSSSLNMSPFNRSGRIYTLETLHAVWLLIPSPLHTFWAGCEKPDCLFVLKYLHSA